MFMSRLDKACYVNSIDKVLYYVRNHTLRDHLSTGYDFLPLIVKKSKLSPEQIEFMECKCEEMRLDEEDFEKQHN